MKADPQSVYVGIGIVGAFAGCLGIWRHRLARIFAASLAGYLIVELFFLVAVPDLIGVVWWTVHMPSAMALGVDEILERHGKVVSTVFHVADFFLWSALITGAVWLYDRRQRDDTHAA